MSDPVFECPLCYFKEREKLAEPRVTWPQKERFMASQARKCSGCGRMTYHYSIGPWKPGP